ncbi:MAG: O-antigen ligase family protein [Candidatus Acidiferrales bacterium]
MREAKRMASSAEYDQTREQPSHPVRVASKWAKVAAILIVGYLGMGKSFAYLGLPWISVYVGEIVLGAFLLLGPKTKRGRWLRLIRRVPQLKRFEWLLLLFLVDGAFAVLRGIARGYPTFTAFRDIAFNYYPIFLFLGIWVGLQDKHFLRRLARVLALWAGCYGLAWILLLNRIPWVIPGTDGRVLLFLGPYGGSAVALLGLLAFEPRLLSVWHLVLLNMFVLLGSTSRADWVGLAVGVVVFAALMKNFMRLAITGGFFFILLGLMYVTGLSIASPTGRGARLGTTISAEELVARGVAPLDDNLAGRLAPSKDVDFAENTAVWRLVWWAEIWGQVHNQWSTTLLGFGYGYPIGELNPDIDPGTFIQTPHSDFFYALAFSGWVGVILFFLLQAELFRLLWRGFKVTGQPFGLMCWAALLTMSFFEDFFEAPFGAIPFFLLVGVAIAPALLARRSAAPNDVRRPLPHAPQTQVA